MIVRAFVPAARALHFVHCHLALLLIAGLTSRRPAAAVIGGLGRVPEVGEGGTDHGLFVASGPGPDLH